MLSIPIVIYVSLKETKSFDFGVALICSVLFMYPIQVQNSDRHSSPFAISSFKTVTAKLESFVQCVHLENLFFHLLL